jgi:hypothetical protein
MALRRVAGKIVRTHIGFCFDDFSGKIFPAEAADQDFSNKIGSDFEGGTGIEGSRQPQISPIAQIKIWESAKSAAISLRGFCLPTNLFLDLPMGEQIFMAATWTLP